MESASDEIYFEHQRVEARLAQLDLTAEVLIEAVQAGYDSLADWTELDPPSAKGILVWRGIVRALRSQLMPWGWGISNDGSYTVTVHPDGRLCIAVAAGDGRTGNREHPTPRTESAKGPNTVQRVAWNQLNLPGFAVQETPNRTGVPTWILLHHYDASTGEIRIEFSFPSGMDKDNHINRWRERLILSGWGSKSTATTISDAIDVPVEPKDIGNSDFDELQSR